MGCLCSRSLYYLSDQPNETSLLLGDSSQAQFEQKEISVIPPSSFQQQDKYKSIVQKTAENVIDISTIRMLDRLQYEYALERASAYSVVLQNVVINPPSLSSVPIIIKEKGFITDGKMKEFMEMLDSVNISLDHFNEGEDQEGNDWIYTL